MNGSRVQIVRRQPEPGRRQRRQLRALRHELRVRSRVVREGAVHRSHRRRVRHGFPLLVGSRVARRRDRNDGRSVLAKRYTGNPWRDRPPPCPSSLRRRRPGSSAVPFRLGGVNKPSLRQLELLAHVGFLLLGDVRVDILLGERLSGESRRLCRKGLRGPRFLARHIRLRNRPLLDRPQRLARLALEHEQETLLGRLRSPRPRSCRRVSP